MDISMSISVVLCALAAILILGNLLKGLRKGMLRSLLRFCFTLAAAVFAFIAMASVYEALGSPSFTKDIFSALKEQPEMQEFVVELEQMKDTLPGLISLLFLLPISLMGPIIFVSVFAVLRFVMGIVYFVVAIFLPKKKKRNSASKLLGALFGTLKGILLTVVVIFPIAGYSAMAMQVLDVTEQMITEEDTLDDLRDVTEIVEIIEENPVIETVSVLGGKHLFSYLTTFSYTTTDGTSLSVSWEKELDQFTQIVMHIRPLQDLDIENMEKEHIDAIKDLAEEIQGSQTVSILTAELLSGVCTAWSDGESFLGMEKPTVESASVESILDAAIDTFKNSTPQTVGEDILSVAELFTVMDKYNIFESINNPEQLMDLFSDDAFLEEAIDVLKENEHLEAVLKETVKSGVKMAVSSALTEEEYDEAMDAINQAAAEQLNALSVYETAEDKQAAISAAITEAMGEYGVEKGGAAADYVAEVLMEEFADQIATGTVTPEDIAAYFGLTE